MKYVFCLLLIVIGFGVSSCGNNSGYEYDNGYEAAWNEDGEPTMFSSKDYREGYQQGLEDADVYDEGYYDGYNKKKSKYPKDHDYMDGYKDGKKDRKY